MLNYATIGVVILYLLYNFIFFFYGCLHRFDDEDKYKDKVYSNLEEFTSWTFMVLALLFVVLGFVLLTKLKRHVPAFYGEHRCLMIWATILLTVPLTFRAVFDFIKLVKPEFLTWVDEDYTRNALYNFFFFLLTTYLPIMGQIMSLVFGFVRHQQGKMKKQKTKKVSQVRRYEQ